MKNLYFLDGEEKDRILNLHESATKRQYLSEQGFNYNDPLNLQNKQNQVVVQGEGSDPYQYMKWSNKFWYAKKSEGKNPKWIEAKSQEAIDSINAKIYGGSPSISQKNTKKKSVPSKTVSPKDKKEKEIIVAKKVVGTESVLNPNASLLFNGDQLQWISNGGVVKTWDAISGLTFKNTPPNNWMEMFKRYTQNPESWSKDKDAGPLPPGSYTIGPIEERNSNTQDVGIIDSLITLWDVMTGGNVGEKNKSFQANTDYSRIGWGNFRATITPTKGTNTYGRHSFFIHGGKFAGSHGCIDLTDQMGDFAKFYGTWSASTKKKSIPLTVNYKTPSENTFFSKLWNTLSNPLKTIKQP